MVIQHNLYAMNAQRMLAKANRNDKKKMEKLSSGYRINRAADDAAGLSISEKMRNQIRGLNQAVKNTEDGIALIQTADGALGIIQDILKRGRELAVKAANDTNCSEDRQAIQDELDVLGKEIENIVDTTAFNGMKVFDPEPVIYHSGTSHTSSRTDIPLVHAVARDGSGQEWDFDVSEYTWHAFKSDTASLFLQVGANSGEDLDMGKYCLTGSSFFIYDIDVSDHVKAIDAIYKYDAGMQVATEVRSYYGAMQNRLEYTVKNLQNYSENLSSAESNIRDADMAEEILGHSKENILAQAAQAMLAQANQTPQGMLSLLQ